MTMTLRKSDRRLVAYRRTGCAASLQRLAAGSALLCLATQGWAQQTPALTVQPRVSLSQTLTDNVQLSAQNKDAALITTIAPGISIHSNSGRVRGSLDYALNGLIYSKTDRDNQVQHDLAAKAMIEAVERWFYVDATASISQQNVSAFGQTSMDPRLRNSNATEVANLSLSPYVQGQLGSAVGYALRATMTESRAKDSVTGDSSGRGLSLSFNGLRSGSVLNWAAAVDEQSSRPQGGRETGTSSATGTLLVTPDVDWNFGLTAGYERNDYVSLSARNRGTYGANANWTPTPRTKLAAAWSSHDYGNSHSLNFEHRMARSAWIFSDTQAVNTGGAQGRTGLMTNYQLFSLQFAGEVPDPVQRDILVRATLARLGLSPNAQTTGGFLSASPNLSRNQLFSFSLQGLRTTLTLALSQSKSRRLSKLTVGPDDLGDSAKVQQRGISVNLAHRLTPTSSASLLLSQQQSRGDLATQRTDLKSLTANWNGRLGQKTSLMLGLRHNRFSSTLQPYRENALLATLVQQF